MNSKIIIGASLSAIAIIGFVGIPYSYASCGAPLFGTPGPCFDTYSVSADTPLTEKSIMEKYGRNIELTYEDWQISDRNWDNEDVNLELPAIICTEFVADGVTEYRMAKWVDSQTISSFENHRDDSLCDKWLAPIDDGIKIKWDQSNYLSNDTGIVEVIDKKMNLDIKKIDSFDIHVWSDVDHTGIQLRVTETDESSGTFEGTVFFTTIDESSGVILLVEDAVYTEHKLNVNFSKIINESESAKFIVQNVEFMQNVFYPDELGYYEVEITDRDGKPVEMFVTGRVDYEAPWGVSNFSPVGNYDKQKQRFVGELTVPGEIIPGIYTLKLNVHGLSEEFTFSGISEVDFTVGERIGSFDTLFEPSSLGSLMGENDEYPIGESRIVNVQLVQGHFYSPPIPNHPASILVYGTDWINFDPNLIEVYDVTSDSNGYVYKELFLDDRNQCDYEVKIKSEFEGFEYSQNFDFRMANTEIFYFPWEGEKIPVTVKGKCSIPLSMNFDQSKKTMTVELDTSDAKKQFEIHFPHRLLDGELTVLINGDVDFDNYSIDKRHDEAIVQVGADSDFTTVEIIGTSAIPEFQTIVMMIMVISMLPIILLRKQLI